MTPFKLSGPHVTLEPLEPSHGDGLRAASADASVWEFAPEGVGLTPAQSFDAWFTRSLGQVGSAAVLPFAVRLSDGTLVGSTRYLNYDPENRRIEVGNTWYALKHRGTFVNPACKLLLATHAFDQMGIERFELKCDARNAPSRAGIAKLGAKEEGTLRHHMVLRDGFVRDTVYFSILKTEWPRVLGGLQARLNR